MWNWEGCPPWTGHGNDMKHVRNGYPHLLLHEHGCERCWISIGEYFAATAFGKSITEVNPRGVGPKSKCDLRLLVACISSCTYIRIHSEYAMSGWWWCYKSNQQKIRVRKYPWRISRKKRNLIFRSWKIWIFFFIQNCFHSGTRVCRLWSARARVRSYVLILFLSALYFHSSFARLPHSAALFRVKCMRRWLRDFYYMCHIGGSQRHPVSSRKEMRWMAIWPPCT